MKNVHANPCLRGPFSNCVKLLHKFCFHMGCCKMLKGKLFFVWNYYFIMCHPYGLHDGRNRSSTDLLAWTATTTKLYRSCDKGTIPALVMAYGLASTGSWPFSSVYLMCQWVITHENSFWSLQLSLSSTFIGLPVQTCIRYYIAAVHVQQNRA